MKDAFANNFLVSREIPLAARLHRFGHNLRYNGSLKCSAFNRRAASSRRGAYRMMGTDPAMSTKALGQPGALVH